VQLIVFDPQDDLISDVDAQAFAKSGRNDYATILIDAHAGF
jgi:hypothetical protein